MKFVKNSKELGTAVNHILSIHEQLVISSGTLESAEKLKHWREAVKEMREVLESIRAIADRTDNVPQMLIGVDKSIHWTDDISWMVWLESPTADPVLVRVPTTPKPENQPTSNVAPSHPMSINKGEGKALPAELQAIEQEWTTQGDVNKDGESEVVEPDIQMDEEMSEPVHGRHKSQSQTKWLSRRDGEPKGEGMSAPSDPPTTPKPKYGQAQVTARTTPPPNPHACRTCINCKVVCTWTIGNILCNLCKKCKIGCGKGNVRCASMACTPKTPAKCQATPTPCNSPRPQMPILLSEVEGSLSSAPQQKVTWAVALIVHPPQEAPQKHAVPPMIRAEPLTNTPLPCQDLIFGQVDEVDRQVADVAGPILVQYQDCMQALEGELADCQLTVGMLTHKIETLRASMHSAHPAQNTPPPPIEADLFNLFGLSTNNAATVEAEESITMQLQGLVFMATPSGQEMVTSSQQDPGLATEENRMRDDWE
ncbi:hypothetical protein BKA83DRAFT_4120417 [Pisolithus microcarpus]|nr:hypothetical protein BKA83DRAFT_4120417 [Pisolithus microcarpus]